MPEALGDPARVVGILERAAARATRREPHRDPDRLGARRDDERRRQRRIDAAGHRDHDALGSRRRAHGSPSARIRGTSFAEQLDRALDLGLVDAEAQREAQAPPRLLAGVRPIASRTFEGSIEPE